MYLALKVTKKTAFNQYRSYNFLSWPKVSHIWPNRVAVSLNLPFLCLQVSQEADPDLLRISQPGGNQWCSCAAL